MSVGWTTALFKACIVAVVLFPVVLSGLNAEAQGNLSSRIETSIKALADADPSVRQEAVSALGQIGTAAVPALIEALTDPDVRQEAARALGEIGPAAQEAVPALIERLADPDEFVRAAAAFALGDIGPMARRAVPTLVQCLADEAYVRAGAASALGKIGPAAVPALSAVLGHPDADVRQSAASALGTIGPAARDAVPALIECLADPDGLVREAAVFALGDIGVADQAAVLAIGRLMGTSRNPDVRRSAAAAFRRIGSLAVPALRGLLTEPHSNVRHIAASALGVVGPGAQEAVAALAEHLADPDESVRAAAAVALGEIGPAAVPALSSILDDDPEADVRTLVVSALQKVGPAAAPTLSRLLIDPVPQVRAAAASALGEIRPAAPEVILALSRVFDDPAPPSRVRSVYALLLLKSGKITYSDSNPDVRRAAANSIVQIAEDARRMGRLDMIAALSTARNALKHGSRELEFNMSQLKASSVISSTGILWNFGDPLLVGSEIIRIMLPSYLFCCYGCRRGLWSISPHRGSSSRQHDS